MDSGLNQMYAIQRPAYAARAELTGPVTDSTPTTPPTHPPLDVAGLCNLKKSVVQNLPTTCGHCGAELPPRSIIEHNGAVVAYCKLKGACGRSQVLYAAVEFKTPIYRQVCKFVHRPSAERVVPGEMGRMNHAELMEMHDPSCANCGERMSQHKKSDQNGWTIIGYNPISYPSDWPFFDSSTGTWGTGSF
eukprot:gene2183-2324_t